MSVYSTTVQSTVQLVVARLVSQCGALLCVSVRTQQLPVTGSSQKIQNKSLNTSPSTIVYLLSVRVISDVELLWILQKSRRKVCSEYEVWTIATSRAFKPCFVTWVRRNMKCRCWLCGALLCVHVKGRKIQKFLPLSIYIVERENSILFVNAQHKSIWYFCSLEMIMLSKSLHTGELQGAWPISRLQTDIVYCNLIVTEFKRHFLTPSSAETDFQPSRRNQQPPLLSCFPH